MAYSEHHIKQLKMLYSWLDQSFKSASINGYLVDTLNESLSWAIWQLEEKKDDEGEVDENTV